jgi:hypothetical protein
VNYLSEEAIEGLRLQAVDLAQLEVLVGVLLARVGCHLVDLGASEEQREDYDALCRRLVAVEAEHARRAAA